MQKLTAAPKKKAWPPGKAAARLTAGLKTKDYDFILRVLKNMLVYHDEGTLSLKAQRTIRSWTLLDFLTEARTHYDDEAWEQESHLITQSLLRLALERSRQKQ